MFSFTTIQPDPFQGIGKESNTMFTADDIFIICENNTPLAYTLQETDAKEYINTLILKLKEDLVIKNPNYNYYITLDEDIMSLWSIYKNWIISFDKLIVEYSYFQIKRVDLKNC